MNTFLPFIKPLSWTTSEFGEDYYCGIYVILKSYATSGVFLSVNRELTPYENRQLAEIAANEHHRNELLSYLVQEKFMAVVSYLKSVKLNIQDYLEETSGTCA